MSNLSTADFKQQQSTLSQEPALQPSSQNMDTSTDVRQRIYLACRAIFSGQNAQFRRRKIIKKLVREHSSTLHPLIEELQESKLIDLIRQLLQEKVFQSISRAEQEFPQLFLSSPAQDAEREASEAGAALLVEQALVDDSSSDDEDYLPAEEVPTPVLDEQSSQSGMVSNRQDVNYHLLTAEKYKHNHQHRHQHRQRDMLSFLRSILYSIPIIHSI